MKAALLSLALLGSQFGSQSVVPVSDHVPKFNIEALCKAAANDDKVNGIVLGQSVENCISDETSARQQLDAVWLDNRGPVRDTCEGEASIGDTKSYVDLLSCMQTAGLATAPPSAAPLKGGGKHRNSK